MLLKNLPFFCSLAEARFSLRKHTNVLTNQKLYSFAFELIPNNKLTLNQFECFIMQF